MTKERAGNRPRDLPAANTSQPLTDRDVELRSDPVQGDLEANTVIDAETRDN
jgi:hypothetical protein